MSSHYKSLARRFNPSEIALFPLSGAIILPGCDLPLNIFEPRYLNMVDDALKQNRLIGMIQNQDGKIANIGSLARITQFSETKDGRYLIVLRGLKRFSIISELDVSTPYRIAVPDFSKFEEDIDAHIDSNIPETLADKNGAKRAALVAAMKRYAAVLNVELNWKALNEIPLTRLIDQAAMISPLKTEDKQSLLEVSDHDTRRQMLIGLMGLYSCLLYTSPSPRDQRGSRMPSSA